MIWETVIQPFAEFGFMRRALLGCMAISLGATPIGVFLMLRRISLTGCAMASAVLPGAATGYLIFGLSLIPMTRSTDCFDAWQQHGPDASSIWYGASAR